MLMRTLTILLLTMTVAIAQEKTYTLTLPASQINVLGKALDKAPLPREETNPVVFSISNQIAVQNSPPPKPEEAPPQKE